MLTCHPNAFTSTKAKTQTFVLSEWDLSDHNFNYLENFDLLNYLLISYSDGFFNSWQSLPPLRELATLSVTHCQNVMGDLITFPSEVPIRSLMYVTFTDDLLDDTSVAAIFKWFYPTLSQGLNSIDISNNRLTTIPSEISLFSSLWKVSMSGNNFRLLPSGSFNFHPNSAVIQQVDVSNCSVEVIEPGAFTGEYYVRALSCYFVI